MGGDKLNCLKLVLIEMDKTSVCLSEQFGVSTVTVSKWYCYIIQSTLPMLDMITELLECEIRELIIEQSYD